MISASHHKWSKKRELKKWSPPWGEEATKQEPHKLPLEAKRQHIPRWTGPFPFLALPLELRRMIYDCYFADLRVFVPAAIRPSQLPRPRSYVPDERDVTMLLVSKQVCREVVHCLKRESTACLSITYRGRKSGNGSNIPHKYCGPKQALRSGPYSHLFNGSLCDRLQRLWIIDGLSRCESRYIHHMWIVQRIYPGSGRLYEKCTKY